jgi:hypothetical protein
MSGISYLSRTLAYLRDKGVTCEKVEHFNPYAGKHGVRHDLFGFIDIIGMGEKDIIAVQACGQDFASHHRKITEEEVAENVHLWLNNGGMLLLIGWSKKVVKRGGKAKRWSARIRKYILDDNENIIWKDV